jgi:type-F conjugative transfer system protein TraW
MSAQKWIIQLSAISVLILCAFITKATYANDLGVMGETYPILEMDFLDFIQSRIEQIQKNGQWQALQNRATQSAISYRDRPPRVVGITRARETKSWKYDPSIVLDHDVISPDGKLIAVAGTRVNPLNFITVTKTLIFYDSDDETQVKWVLEQDKKLNGKDKLILINGSALDQEKRFKKPIYFDQSGKLTSRFSITHVPAIVYQEGTVLRVAEIKL